MLLYMKIKSAKRPSFYNLRIKFDFALFSYILNVGTWLLRIKNSATKTFLCSSNTLATPNSTSSPNQQEMILYSTIKPASVPT